MTRFIPLILLLASVLVAADLSPSTEIQKFIGSMMARWGKETAHFPKSKPPRFPPKFVAKVFVDDQRRLCVRSVSGAPNKEVEDLVRKVVERTFEESSKSEELVSQLSKIETLSFSLP
jgi:phosphoenolpyruvate carboxylase